MTIRAWRDSWLQLAEALAAMPMSLDNDSKMLVAIERRDTLTRVLALIEAADLVGKGARHSSPSCCGYCGQDLCWHAPANCPKARMIAAIVALRAAGDIDP